MAHKALTEEQYNSWKDNVETLKAETKVFRGKNLKINMHIFGKATSNTFNKIREEEPNISQEKINDLALDFMTSMNLEFLSQYSLDLNEYIDDMKSDVEYIKYEDIDKLTSEQIFAIDALLSSIDDYKNHLDNGDYDKDETYTELYRLNFPIIGVMTSFEHGDLRREKLEEMTMLGTNIELFGIEQYEAFRGYILNEREKENESTLKM